MRWKDAHPLVAFGDSFFSENGHPFVGFADISPNRGIPSRGAYHLFQHSAIRTGTGKPVPYNFVSQFLSTLSLLFLRQNNQKSVQNLRRIIFLNRRQIIDKTMP
ncbi:MAG: hypothetical protein ACI4FO_00615 [Acutalibacteraceae bacterium]